MIKINQYIKFLDYPGYHIPFVIVFNRRRCQMYNRQQLRGRGFSLFEATTRDIILHTHGHHDHYFYNHCFPNSTIYMHQAYHAIAQSTGSYLHFFGIEPPGEKPPTKFFFSQSNPVFNYRNSCQDWRISKAWIWVLHAAWRCFIFPGHSAGHCGFLFPDQGFVLSGDY
jgi:glyoxylase-like metal-dependent hydrolase (beta-lactamase superfamily II)